MLEQMENPHGGDIYMASKKYGFKKEDFIDYSANINPLGIPPDLREILLKSMDNISNYPDPFCSDLRSEISSYLGIDHNSIIVGNGASEIIFLLFNVLKSKKVLIPAPSFSEYGQAALKNSVGIEYLELKEADQFKLDIDSLKTHISSLDIIDTIILCNPNNPTSVLTSKAELIELVSFAKIKGINVIIDEAFIELTVGANNNSLANYVTEFDNLYIIRAFTKLFAIPGLRLGYGLGNPMVIKKMWENKLPWSVNSFACEIGCVLQDKTGYLKRTATWLQEELSWFYNELMQIEGLKVYKPNTNFVLMKLKSDKFNSKKLKEIMAFRGILIRDASNFQFLNDRFVRVAIRDRECNIRFLENFKEVIRSK